MKNNSLYAISLVIFSIAGIYALSEFRAPSPSVPPDQPITRTPAMTAIPTSNEQKTTAVPRSEKEMVLFDVPFTPQAPFGEWDNPVYGSGCEEASILMAMKWAKKEAITKEEAKQAILDLSNYALKNYGEFHDLSAKDTAKLLREYYGYDGVRVVENISAEDIKAELYKGNIVIAPINGQKIGNPFYNPPGPVQHMIVIIGYDPEKKEFITNDPGTRRGEKFRYSENALENALQDYPTSFHEPILETNKIMISVSQITQI